MAIGVLKCNGFGQWPKIIAPPNDFVTEQGNPSAMAKDWRSRRIQGGEVVSVVRRLEGRPAMAKSANTVNDARSQT
ncbi:MAG: hypothetical protein GX443_04265 [Deltaproteobacteria bacterium]|nr:hypothetical protein [Deltaproteobacteria bacterium]